MREVRRLELSDEWKVTKGWNLDLGDYGTGEISGVADFDEEEGTAIIYLDKYEFRNWVFTNVKIEVELEEKDLKEIQNVKTLDDILICEWKNWNIEPTQVTKAIKKGDPKDIEGTTFDVFLPEGN